MNHDICRKIENDLCSKIAELEAENARLQKLNDHIAKEISKLEEAMKR